MRITGFALGIILTATYAAAESAVELNDKALELAYENNLQQALPYFQRAVQLDPRSPEYLNNLGVTEMRLGRLMQAKQSFEKALKLFPTHEEARENLRELTQFIEQNPQRASQLSSTHGDVEEVNAEDVEFDDDVDTGIFRDVHVMSPEQEKIEHTVSRLPRIALADLYKDENIAFVTGRKPYILVGSSGGWEEAEQWDATFFSQKFANVTVDFYPHNMAKENVRPFLTPMAKAMEELQQPSGRFPSDGEHPGQYVQWNINSDDWSELYASFGTIPPQFMSDDQWLHSCLSNISLRREFHIKNHWRMLLIGTKGAGMFHHIDTLRTSSWQYQITGAKRWHLCGPENTELVYGAGKVNMFHPNYAKFPKVRNVNCYLDTVKRGEFVFYPKDYWHQTYNMEDWTISISSTLAEADNHFDIAQQMRQDCTGARLVKPSKDLCAALDNCFEMWESVFFGRFVHADRARTCSLDEI